MPGKVNVWAGILGDNLIVWKDMSLHRKIEKIKKLFSSSKLNYQFLQLKLLCVY